MRLGRGRNPPEKKKGMGVFPPSNLEDQFCGSHRRWQDRGRIDSTFESKTCIRDQPKASAHAADNRRREISALQKKIGRLIGDAGPFTAHEAGPSDHFLLLLNDQVAWIQSVGLAIQCDKIFSILS